MIDYSDIPEAGNYVEEIIGTIVEESNTNQSDFLLKMRETEKIMFVDIYDWCNRNQMQMQEAVRCAASCIQAYRKWGETPEFYKRKQAIKEQYGDKAKKTTYQNDAVSR